MSAANQRPVGIGLIGFGTIGTGVAKVLARNADVIAQRLGFPLRLVRIADLDTQRERGVDLGGIRFDSDAEGLIADPAVEIVIELIGGHGVAKKLILASIAAGKHVVTANKALLARDGAEIFRAAAARGVDVAFEASVGGGIPILRSIREGLAANHIEAVYGILNGTTNYMLTQMEAGGEAYEAVLARAQALGYAEADPTFDVDGIDAAHKLGLLASMCFGAELHYGDLPAVGIRGLVPLDFEAAASLGYRIKLLGVAKWHARGGGALEAHVHPTLVPRTSLLASVDGAMNAVVVIGDAVGKTLFYGAGAGELPTASAVVADLMEIAREIRRGRAGRVAPLSYLPEVLERRPLLGAEECEGRFYLRFTALDRAGVLARITGLLAGEGVGIESVLQKGRGGEAASVPVIVVTHPVREAALRRALVKIDALPETGAATQLLRIEAEL